MSDRDPPTALDRTRHAKGDERSPPRIDGGAIAVGLLCALVAFVPAAIVSIPLWTAAALAAGGLLVGGYAAATLTARESCAVCHAGVVGVTFYTVVAALAATTYLAPDPPVSAVVLAAIGTDVRAMLAVALFGLVLSAIGGYLGAATRAH